MSYLGERNHLTDGIDRKLIELLWNNSRASSVALARALELTPPAVASRINKLTDRGIIRITSFVDPTMAGSPLGVAVGMQVVRSRIKEVVSKIASHQATVNVAECTGSFNVMEAMFFTSLGEMSDFFSDVVLKTPGILSSETFLLLPLTRRVRRGFASNPMDDIDWAIARALRQNGRATTVTIARDIGVSPITVQRHLKQLLDSHLLRVVTLLNLNRVDWYWPGALGIRAKREAVLAIMRRLAGYRQVPFVSCCTGRFDIIANIYEETEDKLHRLVEEEIALWEGVVDFELFRSTFVTYGPVWGG